MSAESGKGRSDFSPWPDEISAHVLAEILSCHQSWRHGVTDTPMSPQMIDDGLNGAIDYLRSDPVRAALVEALKEASESLGHMGAEHLKSRVDAALKAAGVVLS